MITLSDDILQERKRRGYYVKSRCFLCKCESKFNATFELKGSMMGEIWKHPDRRELDGFWYFKICTLCLTNLVEHQMNEMSLLPKINGR
jgi:hypothetical protein